MKVDAAREYAGGVNRKVLYRAVADEKLKVARIGSGRNFLWTEAWIDAWLNSMAQPADDNRRSA